MAGQRIPTVQEEPVNSLGRVFDETFKDRNQETATWKMMESLDAIGGVFLPRRFKVWLVQDPRSVQIVMQAVSPMNIWGTLPKSALEQKNPFKRDNNIVKILEWELQERGYIICVEPRNPTNVGIKIPDLCAWKDGKYVVLDVTVVADTLDLDYVHESKKDKYDMLEIHAWMEKNAQERTSKLEPIVTACD